MEPLNDLSSFAVVAEELNFRRAAARLNVSPSALSQTIRKLEERLGIRLLMRTTRSVALTPAGERLSAAVTDGLSIIRQEIGAMSAQSDAPAGHIRVNASEYAALRILEPALRDFLPDYPKISVEVVIDNGFVDIVAQKFDLGIRAGESVERDMISFAVRPEEPIRIVGSPEYFAQHARPEHPNDLLQHHCINMRFSGSGELFPWEFEKDGNAFRVRVPSRFIVSGAQIAKNATITGMGLCYMPQDLVEKDLAEGKLISVLDEWTVPLAEHHVYYPSRSYQTTALSLFLKHLRAWGKEQFRSL
ncbi:DNA-binding transcriptional regulator, LysR family [Cohaesibacter marisflavi]|uniref:DNA-binding transcriptional regulator, LysR family n=1 Tax=Cohaesibacter marisflavi TaxID=655353 RepID=A0A1I5N6Y4_9HYPH|nr:LysR family transcriptional regulator [Cohaesibacter marisflavi]SFP17362.1 DNA-binding transcriptional regulator, LysR family [Cohaesibacter marisflavi]